ncbi:SPOR domain-containing protein [Novosphingobium huizhouense]|uniref:SPOR domain-containing protein n=1 Tax=Novosphingobium huizhouense TaxID=2866625 RepID=UPI001CD85AED|nr:SPOR domain-containing protein [Novosphingobium huizhouense]
MTLRAEIRRSWNTGLALSLSTVFLGSLVAGCSAVGVHPSRAAAGADAAAVAGRTDKAIALAERAVLTDPRNAARRTALGNAYLRAGRFESARQAFDEAMQLGDDSGKAALSLALADIAMGRFDTAADTLDVYRASIPDPDYGLAMAMAGRTQQGVSTLVAALRAGDDSPKLRQNLAYAYALAGQWREARVMAAQDLPADQLDARMQQWLLSAGPRETRTRVAALLGAPLRADAGQPQALALVNFPEHGAVRQADSGEAAAPGGAATPAAATPVLAEAATQELPAVRADDEASAAAPAPAPTLAEAAVPPSSHAATHVAYRVVGANALRPAPVAPAASRAPAAGGSHVVQLGAFSSAEGARRAWRHFVAKSPTLSGYKPLITQANVHGRMFWRVQAAGFQGYARASALCGTVKARGGSCLVMASASAPAPVAAAETRFARRR